MLESYRRKSGESTGRIFVTVLIAVLLLSLIGCSSVQNYSNAKIGANETSAILSLRSIGQAELLYFNTHQRGFGTLKELSEDHLIPAELAAGERNGYRFTVRIIERSESGQPAYEANAIPVNYGSTGKRSFYLNEEAVIRQADKNGSEATAKDPALD
jgi:type IV pilus assembly protein PilA